MNELIFLPKYKLFAFVQQVYENGHYFSSCIIYLKEELAIGLSLNDNCLSKKAIVKR